MLPKQSGLPFKTHNKTRRVLPGTGDLAALVIRGKRRDSFSGGKKEGEHLNISPNFVSQMIL